MRVPKRFRLHEVGETAVHIHQDSLVAVGHASVVRVPIRSIGPPVDDVLRLEPAEDMPKVTQFSSKALRVAAQGTKGEGFVRFLDTGTEACAGGGKPWTRHELTDEPFPEQELGDIFDRLHLPPAEGRHDVEVVLDAEALVRVARAIGAGGDGVRLRFHVVTETGRCDTERGMIEVRPARSPSGGAWGVLMAVAIQ